MDIKIYREEFRFVGGTGSKSRRCHRMSGYLPWQDRQTADGAGQVLCQWSVCV